MNIGQAVEHLKNGKRVARAGWNGKRMFLLMIGAGESAKGVFNDDDGQKYQWQNYVAMKTADDRMVPWLCSQTDLLADDWELVE